MLFSASKNSSTRFGLLVFLILLLFLCAIFFYIRNNKANVLTADINHLAALKEDYSQIDSCIIVLYNADNNSRLFAINGQATYIKKYARDINFVSRILEKLKQDTEDEYNKSSRNLKGLVNQKKNRTELYLKLRLLTDSLISMSSGIDTITDRFKPEISKGLTYKNFKTIKTIDTIHFAAKEEKEKNFIGRVTDAFSRKKSKKVNDSSSTVVRTEIKLDTSIENRTFNQLQAKNMNNYFRNLYLTNNKLKKNEEAVLQLNSQIINEIVSLLQSYKNREITIAKENKTELKGNIDDTFKSIDRMMLVSIALLLILVFTILYNLFKIYKNETELLDYGQKASQYALSKSRFLANMSHEIRTPLNSVIGFSEQLSKGDLDVQQAEQVSAIRSSSVMLLDVVNDILDFSKYETGKVSFDKVSFGPLETINDVFNSIGIQATNKGIKLEKKISFDEAICFSGDALRLKQVIMNLLSNAIKFTDVGSVTLEANVVFESKKSAKLKVNIIDTGIGISSEDLEMIFDEFAQVYYSSTKIKQKGTGLGLAICKKIVELQGGRINVTSELGKGAVFSFEIPYEVCTKERIAIEKNVLVADTVGLENKRILLADDNKMNILLAKTVIKKYKMHADVAYNGKEALGLFEENDYDLILTDIQMPEMGGIELTRIIRAHKDIKKSKIAILGVTANVLLEDRKKYIESGINDLVLKPFSEKELVDKISSYVRKN